MSLNRLLTCVLVLTIILCAGSARAAGTESVPMRPAEALSPADWDAIRAHLPDDEAAAAPPRPEAYGGPIELTASDGAADDRFGLGSAVFGDVVAVGANLADIGGKADQGAVYIYYRNQGGTDNWGEVAKVTASDGEAGDNFGSYLALHGDHLAVGSYRHDSGGEINSGAVYIYSRNQGGADHWGEVRMVIASDYSSGAFFGRALDLWGDTLVVGAWPTASAYVFSRNQGGSDQWGEVRKLTASVGGGYFGLSVTIHGDLIAAGAYGTGSYTGAAYLFARNEGGADNWGEVAAITASDGAADDRFGLELTLGQDLLAVAAPYRSAEQGAVYLYARNEGGADAWGETHILTASYGGPSFRFGNKLRLSGDSLAVSDDSTKTFLFSLNEGGAGQWGLSQVVVTPSSYDRTDSLHGDTLVIGIWSTDIGGNDDQGVAYIYTAGDGWKERKKQNDPYGSSDDFYGCSVEIDGEFAIVGAYGDNIGGVNERGSASILRRNEGGADEWSSVALLTASDGAADDKFGYSVSLSGDTAVVGARFANDGQAYIFQRNHGGADNWGEVAIISGSGNTDTCCFGGACAIHGDTVLVGASETEVGGTSYQGAAYIFARNEGGADNWGEVAMLTASDGAYGDRFGWSVALFGDMAVVGAVNDDHPGIMDGGSVYLFSRNQGGADDWGEVAKLTASDTGDFDCLGDSVAIWGDTILAGANGYLNFLGAAYLFERNDGGADNWGQVAILTASDGQSYDLFGNSVGLWADTALVGANAWNSHQGSAYLFHRNEGGADNWGEVDQLIASIGQSNDNFASKVSLDGDIAMVGSYEDDIGPDADQGSVYFFYNHFPTAMGDSYTTDVGVTLDVPAPGVLANDGDQNGDAFTAVKDSDPSSGTLDFYADGSFEYTPSGCPSQDSFTYHTTDTMEDSPIATVTIDVAPGADLEVSMTDDPDPVCSGSPVEYMVTVDNAGPCDATDVTLNDDLPAGLGSISAVPSQGSCSINGQLVACDLGSLAVSGSATVTITATPSATGSYPNTVSVSATEDDPDAGDDDATETTQVVDTPIVPAAPSVADADPCAATGVTISWDPVADATGYDIQVDGAGSLPDVTSPHTYDPMDSDPHTFAVRAWNGCGTSAFSATAPGTDGDENPPPAPGAPTVEDISACDFSGISITWSPVSGATGYDLQVDGTETVSGVTSPHTYYPIDQNPHTYTVRSVNECGGGAWSGGTVGTDGDGVGPGAPVITAIDDADSCGTGVTISFTPGSGALSHDLLVGGAVAATGITNPYFFDDGSSGQREFTVRAVDGSCHTDSLSEFGDDIDNSPTPSILGLSSNTCPEEFVTLTTEAGMGSYQWYLDGSPIGGATSDLHEAAATGGYTVSYTNGSGCTGTSISWWVTIAPCGSGIYPAPDGSGDTTPVTAVLLDADTVRVQWDSLSCTAYEYHMIFGSLSGVSSYAIEGSHCGLGTLGTYDWDLPGTGDYFFLILGSDGMGIESSWGTDSSGSERNGTDNSGACMAWDKDTSLTCP